MKILFATGNAHKLEEIRKILDDATLSLISMKEAGVFADPKENGKTFEENALIKAHTVHDALIAKDGKTDAVVLADDSGLQIDALNGEPGIYSARYLGEDTPYDEKNAVILKRMRDVPLAQRSARFVCAVAAVFPDGTDTVVKDTMEGQIAFEAAGVNGFGYDPIFFLPAYGKTSAELPPEEKNRISHRGKALRKMWEGLEK